MKETVYLIFWDECDGEAHLMSYDENENELILPITCTDDELVAFLRRHSGDEADPDGEWGEDWQGRPNQYGWRCADVSRAKNTATVEWRSDRDHMAVTTVIWF